MNHLAKSSIIKAINLSFSGAGHLLPYHLGVSVALLQCINLTENSKRLPRKRLEKASSNKSSSGSSSPFKPPVSSHPQLSIPPIKAVGGSSSGAIAAVIFTKLPHRLEEYAEEFIQTRGKALETLSKMLLDEERHWSSLGRPESSRDSGNTAIVSIDQRIRNKTPSLYIATTRCNDGSSHLFRFNTNEMYSTISSSWNTDSILQAVRASCTIPPSFHPVDLLPGLFFDKLSYPDEEGIPIDGKYYVDGGISSPAPKIPKVNESTKSIIVSPISYTSYGNNMDDTQDEVYYRISPSDDSTAIPIIHNVKFRNSFLVKPSLQNVHALRVAGGMASSDELREWYELGIEDGNKAIGNWKDGEFFLNSINP